MKNKNMILTGILALSLGALVFNAMPLTVSADNPIPAITSISPSATVAGNAGFTITVNGNNFIPTSTVMVNGSARTTTYVSPTQLTATILASDVSSTGSPSITVANSAPGGGTSNSVALSVTPAANNPVPSISSISPATRAAGSSAFTMTIAGNNFIPSSIVAFNGSIRPSTYVSPTQLTVSVPASDIAATGTYYVAVLNGTPGGGTSNLAAFTVTSLMVTPSLPNTGFGPANSLPGTDKALLAAIVGFIGSISLVALIRMRARLAR